MSEIGRMRDADGDLLIVAVHDDQVAIEDDQVCLINLDAGQREHFQRLFMEAERQAEAWAQEHAAPADDVVEAEIWCGLGIPGAGCVNGPAEHLWDDRSCHTRSEAAFDEGGARVVTMRPVNENENEW